MDSFQSTVCPDINSGPGHVSKQIAALLRASLSTISTTIGYQHIHIYRYFNTHVSLSGIYMTQQSYEERTPRAAQS